MTRILFLVNDLTVMGGSTKVTYQLANEWSKQHEVKIAALFQSQSKFPFYLSSNVTTEVLYSKQCYIHEFKTYIQFLKSGQWLECFRLIKTLSYLLLYRKQAKKNLNNLAQKVDVIIIPDIHGLSFLSLKNLNEKKIMVQLHNTYAFLIQNRLIMRTLLSYQDKINYLITLTKHDQHAFQKLGFKNVEQIYNAVAIPEKTTSPKEKKIVFLGRLDSRKGVDFLIPLMQRVKDQHPNAHLYVYGSGPEEQWLYEQIQAMNLQSRITLHGHTSCLDEVFMNAVCCWLPSRWEGLPLTLLEALAYGVPVVAFQCFDGISEVLPHQEAGYIISQGNINDFANATIRLLTDLDCWQMMSNNARRQAIQFNPITIQSKWQNLLNDITDLPHKGD